MIATCGHAVTVDGAVSVIAKGRTREGDKALSYRTDCPACRDEWQRLGLLFPSEDAAETWLAAEWDEDEEVL